MLKHRRIEVPVGISYADDPQKARQVIVDAINEKDYVINKDETNVYAESFGDSSVNLLLWFWIRYLHGLRLFQTLTQWLQPCRMLKR